MKKLLPILIITLTSLLITKEVWSLPNCSGNYWNNCMGVFTFELDHPNWRGATYSGEWKNGKADGSGIVTYPDGGKYVGQFKNDMTHGQGTYTFPSGDKFVGEWKDDMFHGQGTYTTADGYKFEGEWKDNAFYGQGTLILLNGDKYVGQFKNDMFHGQGTYTSAGEDSCATFESKNGLVDLDTQTVYLADSFKYVGEWKDDMFHGQGTYTWCGHKYVGQFKNDSFHGQGTLTSSANREKYVGEWKDDMRNGQGTNTWSDGTKYAGEWQNDYRTGLGAYTYPDGRKYVGELKDGKKDGQGTMTYPDGRKYVGEWQNDYRTGLGKLFFPDGTSEEGVYKDNVFQYAKDVDKVYSAASGSGFAVTSDGYVITNYHVIEGCTDVKIHDKGKSILATLVTFDPNNDIALLKGDFKPRSFYSLSRETPKLLMDVYVAGHPFGQQISTTVKVTKGIVSSLTGIANNFSNIQIDAALQPGNSGGPIMNDKGNVIGVAVAKLDLETIVDAYGVVPENVNFGVKANVVINILESENIKLPTPNTKTIPTSELSEMITDGTYYLSCWMTLAQIETMLETKVMFKDLK